MPYIEGAKVIGNMFNGSSTGDRSPVEVGRIRTWFYSTKLVVLYLWTGWGCPLTSGTTGVGLSSIVTEVSSKREVLDRLKVTIEDRLRAFKYQYPQGGHSDISEAFMAWVRIWHRSVPRRPRRVHCSDALKQRTLDNPIQEALVAIL
jgi:hypothetical protein